MVKLRLTMRRVWNAKIANRIQSLATAPISRPDWVDSLTPVERALLRVPGLRLILRWPLRAQRDLRVERAVKQQIGDREAFDAKAWGNDSVRQRIARAVGEAIADNLDFAQPHFVPDDPIDLVLYDRDFLVGVQIRIDIEDALGRSMPDECYDSLVTVGELVDRITEHVRENNARIS